MGGPSRLAAGSGVTAANAIGGRSPGPCVQKLLQLYRSRRSPVQARLLRILSTGVRGGVSSPQFMHILRDLNAMMHRPHSAGKGRRTSRAVLDLQGREVTVPLRHKTVPDALEVHAWPGAGPCKP